MHFVQDLARVGKSVENIHPDEITLEAIDNAIEHAKKREAFIKQSKSVSAADDPGKFDKSKQWFTWGDRTCVLGQNFIIAHYSQRTCSVRAFSDSYSPINNIPIVQGATAYDCSDTGQTYILVINEGLYFGTSMSHSLINPNQLRHFGTIVQDNPYSNE